MLFVALASREILLREFDGNRDLVWSESEKTRLDQYKTLAQRQRLIAGHGLARRVLVEHLGSELSDWRLNAASGEPPGVADHPDLYLSLTHSGEWYACALSDQPIGVDIEVLKTQRDVPAMAEIICNKAEIHQLSDLNEAKQASHFARLWTLKEAALKQQGLGLDFNRMRQLVPVISTGIEAHAVTWFDRPTGLVVALASPISDRVQPQWPDEFQPKEIDRWVFTTCINE